MKKETVVIVLTFRGIVPRIETAGAKCAPERPFQTELCRLRISAANDAAEQSQGFQHSSSDAHV